MDRSEIAVEQGSSIPSFFPVTSITRWRRPFVRFLHLEAASGVLLLICTAIAIILANSPLAEEFAGFWRTSMGVRVGEFELFKPLLLWVNDGLMTIFFFVVGLEIKREIVAGELRDPRKAALPIMAAIGGMLAPAGIYYLLQSGQPGERGWGIPMATDIAFVVGFLALLGPRVPFGLKILLLSLAIADDIGAVIVIALFYSTNIALSPLYWAGAGLALIVLFNRLGVRRVPIYVLLGAGIWLAFLKSGVHPTVAGVLLGLLTPASAWIGDMAFRDLLQWALSRFMDSKPMPSDAGPVLGQLRVGSREAISPLERLETGLHPWVAFLIMPIFALANAGVSIELSALSDPVALAVAAGLFLGKPLGIFVFCWLAVTVGLARLPQGVNWKVMAGAGCLAGIGFTMSIFIAGLALEGAMLDAGKLGTLIGSASSAIVGFVLLKTCLPHSSAPGRTAEETEQEMSLLQA